jgi:hypothetical protein
MFTLTPLASFLLLPLLTTSDQGAKVSGSSIELTGIGNTSGTGSTLSKINDITESDSILSGIKVSGFASIN